MRILCEAGDNYIVPSPGYWHLEHVARCFDLQARSYGFEGSEWAIDFAGLESQIDNRTRFILVVSPGNPNCVHYSRDVLARFVKLAEKYGLTLLSDEIYMDYYFDESAQHVSVAHFDSSAPVLIMAGLAKGACVPGFGFEWLCVKDPQKKIQAAVDRLAHYIDLLGSNSAFLVNIFPGLYDEQLSKKSARMQHIAKMYELVKGKFEQIEGLEIYKSNASMFVTIKILTEYFKDITDDMDFVDKLYSEYKVKLGRGTFNGSPAILRISLVCYEQEYNEAIDRLKLFVGKHRK